MDRYATDSGEVSLTGADQWAYANFPEGYFEVYVRGTYAATVALQCRPVGTTEWIDRVADMGVLQVSSGIEFSAAAMEWRLGIPAGAYTSGTAVARLYRGAGAR